MTAVRADFSNMRVVQGRGVVQLIFEVPIEAADRALASLGGIPDPSKSAWCEIRRLKSGATEEPPLPPALDVSKEGSPAPGPPAARGC